MKSRMMLLVCGAVLCLLSLHISVPPAAEAYLDPGTGSYFLQILAAGLLSGLFMLKPLINKIKGILAKLQGRSKEHNSGDSL